MDVLSMFRQESDRVAKIVAGIRADQLGLPTPCAQMDVRGVLNHFVGANWYFLHVAEGRDLPDEGERDLIADDPAGALETARQAVLETFSAPDILTRTFRFPFGEMPGEIGVGIATLETVVHGWDLAKATGQDTSIAPEIATALLAGAQGLDGFRSPTGDPFGPAVSVPDDASPGDKLIAFTGRQP